MSVKIDASGRRSIQVEVEVPGTPEDVWQAIATGPGVSSWFVPTEVEPRVGGAVVSHFGPGMDSSATVTAWDPPHRFADESPMFGPDTPPVATEWVVEARSGGTCVVRVVHSLFSSAEDWDGQLNAIEAGWPAFFRILRLYLTHYRGQPCSMFQVMGAASDAGAWDAFMGALGLDGSALGERRSTAAGPPPTGGVVEALRDGYEPYRLLLLDEPAPGAAFLSACDMGGQIYITIAFYLYGEHAAESAARDEPRWSSWLKEHLGQAAPAA